MAEYDRTAFLDNQRQSWDQAASAWEKWDSWLDSNMTGLNKTLAQKAKIKPGDKTLDLGSGTGYPAIEVAKTVGENGAVTGLDISENMLKVARKKAEALGLGNTSFETCDIRKLPFENDTFNAVTSRFCLMFLPHLDDTLSETHRALKPGGSLAALVWAAGEKNPSIMLPITVLKNFTDVPQPDPAMPGLFSLAKPGLLSGRVKSAGFSDVVEQEVGVDWYYTSGEEYVESFLDLAAPIKQIFNKLNPGQQEDAKKIMAKEAEKFREGDRIHIPGLAIMVSGTKSDS